MGVQPPSVEEKGVLADPTSLGHSSLDQSMAQASIIDRPGENPDTVLPRGDLDRPDENSAAPDSTEGSLIPANKAGSVIPDNGAGKPSHLLVLVHGVSGSAANWVYTKAQFEAKFGNEVLVFSSKSVENCTLGIDVLGKKLVQEVLDLGRANPTLKKVSFVSHSLGGLVARYAIAKLLDVDTSASSDRELHAESTDESCEKKPGTVSAQSSSKVPAKPVLQLPTLDEDLDLQTPMEGSDASTSCRHTIAGLTPVNFVTLASPHLGSRGKGALPFASMLSILARHSHSISPLFLGDTARHLFLTDAAEPLLLRMCTDCADGHFITALKAFKYRTIYSNVGGDQMVGWQTSSVRQSTELPQVSSLVDVPGYKHVQIEGNGGESEPATEQEEQNLEHKMLRSVSENSSPSTSLRKDPLEDSEASSGVSLTSLAVYQAVGSSTSPASEVQEPAAAEVGAREGGESLGKGSREQGSGGPKPLSHMKKSQSEVLDSRVGASRAAGVLNAEMEDLMAQRLSAVGMQRFECNFLSSRLSFLAHNLIQVKDYWIHKAGAGVIQHVVDNFEL